MTSDLILGHHSPPMPLERVGKRRAASTYPLRRGPATVAQRRRTNTRVPSSGPLRRSARLAEASTRRTIQVITPSTTGAGITSHSQPDGPLIGGAPAEHYAGQIARQRLRRGRLNDGSDDNTHSRRSADGHQRPGHGIRQEQPTGNNYAMHIVSEPPSQGEAGQRLGTGMTLQVRALPGASSSARMDLVLGRLFVVASLVDADSNGPDAAPIPDLLGGQQLVETVQASRTPDDNDAGRTDSSRSDALGRVSFPELVVHSPGEFRIRVTLVRMGPTNGLSASNQHGGVSTNDVETGRITII
jgi:hypothetical protein